jgi:hypothetical protein
MENNKKDNNIQPVVWKTREFREYNRDIKWYLSIGGALLIALIYAVYIRQWILVAVILMIAVVIYLSGDVQSKTIECKVDKEGVKIGDKKFLYGQLKTFWFSDSDGITKLNLITIFRLMPVISLDINKEIKTPIKEILLDFIPESDNKGEDWMDRIHKFLKI